jgi:hypothetical protein
LLTHHLMRLGQELESPRLSALHSTLGLVVLRAALRSLGSGTADGGPPHTEELPAPGRRAAAHAA